ncbi:MAG: general secretion pathway protein GspC [Legionella sp.]|nr:MAG: general secretion pathway protein GspC [Legionella sp.]
MFSVTDIEDRLLKPHTAQIIFLLVACVLGYELISGVVTYYQLHSELKLPIPQSAHPKTLKRSTITQSLNTQIFGEYVPKALVDADVKPSGLNLSLVGILFSTKNEASHAIINISDGNAHLFSVGDAVPGGAKIKQITPDGVILEREGEFESLSLPKNELTFEPLPKPLDGDSE